MRSVMKEVIEFAKELFGEFNRDQCMQYAAAMAYYTIFSLPPLLVIVLGIAGFFFDADVAAEKLTSEMKSVIAEEGAAQVKEMVSRAEKQPNTLLSTILGFVALLVGATGALAQLQTTLNRIWEVEADPDRSGIVVLLLKRVFSLGVIMVIAFLLLVSLTLTAIISAFSSQLTGILPDAITGTILSLANATTSFIVVTLLFTVLLKYLPDAKVRWKDVFVGALFTSILFAIGKWGLGLYLGNSSVGSAFGQAKSVILILLWVYYSVVILFLGAEFTEVWSRRYGKPIRPSKHAVRAVHEVTHLSKDYGKRSADEE